MEEIKVTLGEKLIAIQKALVVNKTHRNNFGNYNYRNAEDILEAVKPLLDGCVLTLSDEIIQVGDRYYVKATARIENEKQFILATAFAREEESKKGMDASQITGSASSYARKYALNGLFCIDDGVDADSKDNTAKPVKTQSTFTSGGKITDKQLVLVNTLISKTSSDREKIHEVYGVESLKDLNLSQASKLIDQLNAKQDNQLIVS